MFSMKYLILGLSLSTSLSMNVQAAIQKNTVEYKEGSNLLEGFVAYDDSSDQKRPAVIVVHEWMGLDDYAKRRAEELAKQGYLAMAADIYGKGIRAKNTEEAGKLAKTYRADPKLMRARIKAAYNELKKNKFFDPKQVAIIGYCFGGTIALEAARSGMNIAGVVSFHGGLATKAPAKKGDIRAKVLVLHGADDPYESAEEVKAFQEEMKNAKADWQFFSYGNAVHGFSKKEAGNDVKSGYAYNRAADQRSYRAMLSFFEELFGKKS